MKPIACSTWVFFDDIVAVAKQCPEGSPDAAVFRDVSGRHAKLSQQFLRKPQEIKLTEQHTNRRVKQRFYEVHDTNACTPSACCSITTNRSARSRSATRSSNAATCSTSSSRRASTHSRCTVNWNKRERDQVLVQFANRSCSVLVATDVAARGLDIGATGGR